MLRSSLWEPITYASWPAVGRDSPRRRRDGSVRWLAESGDWPSGPSNWLQSQNYDGRDVNDCQAVNRRQLPARGPSLPFTMSTHAMKP